jgi:hypothetical protein
LTGAGSGGEWDMRPLFESFNLEEDKEKLLALYAEMLRCRRELRKAERANTRARRRVWEELASQCKARQMKLGQLTEVLGMSYPTISSALKGARQMARDDLNRVFREWDRIDEGVRKFRKTYGEFMARAKEM